MMRTIHAKDVGTFEPPTQEMINKSVIVVCLRMPSSRIPNKSTQKIDGIPAIHRLVHRLTAIGLKVIFAVPPAERTMWGKLIPETEQIRIATGDPESPLHRMEHVVYQYANDAEWVIRVTGDDLFTDETTLLNCLRACMTLGDSEMIGYAFMPQIVRGADCEIIHRHNLIAAAEGHQEPTEFITYFVKGQKPRETILYFEPRPEVCRPYRLEMDYPADLQLLDVIHRQIETPFPGAQELVRHLDKYPELLRINKLPTMSFYTCAYNAEKWIDKTIASVLFNEGPFEYVVVDDGSTDKTVNRIAQWLHDPRIKLVTLPENRGLAEASNVALKHCRSGYVMRVDADDVLLGQAQASIYGMMEQINQGAAIVYPAYYEMDEDGVIGNTAKHPAESHHPGCAMMSTRILNEFRFRDGLRHWDGLELYKRLRASAAQIVYYPGPTWAYRRRAGSLSQEQSVERAKALEDINGGKQ